MGECVSFGVTRNFLAFSVFFCFFYSDPSNIIFSHAVPLNIVSPLEQLPLFSTSLKEEQQFYKQNKQSTHPFDIVLLKKKKKKRPRPDLRFTRVAICMLRPINFSWLSHYEHSQPEGGNAKLICVLKLLSQAGITGKCSDYPLGT